MWRLQATAHASTGQFSMHLSLRSRSRGECLALPGAACGGASFFGPSRVTSGLSNLELECGSDDNHANFFVCEPLAFADYEVAV